MAIINNGSGFIYVDADPNTDLTPNVGEDSEVAWNPSANDLYFWNRGNSEWDLFSPGGKTIYSDDDTLSGDRKLTMGGYDLDFDTGGTNNIGVLLGNTHTDIGLEFKSPGGYGGAEILHSYQKSGLGHTNLSIANNYGDARIELVQDQYNVTGSSSSIRFYTSTTGAANIGVERMRIDSLGRVGIGTVAAAYPLDIVGGFRSQGYFTASNPDDNALVAAFVHNGSPNAFRFTGNATNSSTFTMINNSLTTTVSLNSDGDSYVSGGRFGVGIATPAYKLDVDGTAGATNFEQSGSSDNLFVGYSEFGGGISMESTKIENMLDPTNAQDAATKAYVDANSGSGGKFVDGTDPLDAVYNDGNVGVGTDDPTQELHVVGGVRITGAIYDSNNEPGTSGQVLSSTVTGTDWVDMPISTASLTNHYVKASLTSAYLTDGGSEIDFDANSDNTLIGLSQDESVGSDITFASNTFTVSGNGLYTATISAEFLSEDTQRSCPTVSILVNGSVVDGKSLAYVRNSNAASEGTVNLTRTLNLTDGDTISVRWRNQGVTSSDPTTAEQFMVEVFKHAFTVTGALGSSGKFIDGTNTADAVYNAGNVGVKTSDPTQDFHVVGNARITGAIYDSNNSPGTNGQVLSSTVTGTDWIDAGGGDSIYTANGTLGGDREVTFNGNSLTYTTTNGTFEYYSDNVFVYTRSVTGNDTTVRYFDSIVLLHEDTSGSKNIDTGMYVESTSPRFTQTQDTLSAGFYITSTSAVAMQVDSTTVSASIELSDKAMTVTDAATIYTGEAEYLLSTSEPSLGLGSYDDVALIRFTGTNSSTIHGMSSGVTGRQIAFTNNTSGTITFKSLSGTATNSAHRFYMHADVTVASGGAGIFHYSGEKWRILSAVG